jgi:hypothetical protein
MLSKYRQYATDEQLAAFNRGLSEILESAANAVVVLRLSIRTINRRPALAALIGVPGQPGGRTFELALPTAEPTDRQFAQLGRELAHALQGWLRPEAQEALHREAAGRGYDAHASTPDNDLVRDIVEEWEATWRAHLNGKLHIKAKDALLALLLQEIKDVRAEEAADIGPLLDAAKRSANRVEELEVENAQLKADLAAAQNELAAAQAAARPAPRKKKAADGDS